MNEYLFGVVLLKVIVFNIKTNFSACFSNADKENNEIINTMTLYLDVLILHSH
jgi:hypothetical protein